MLAAAAIKGCYPAVITPMLERNGHVAIDWDTFFRLIEKAVDAGCTGIVFAGTTGQSATISHSEHIELVARGSVHGRSYAEKRGRGFQIIGSAGSNSTAESLYLMESILREARVDAFLHVTGYYNNPPQEGLLKHYYKVADFALAHDVAVVMYNVPARTKSNLEAETVCELARHPAIKSVKEASGDLAQIQRIIEGTRGEDFTVVSGEDDQVAAIMKMGGSGVISASANQWGREFQRMTELAAEGRHDAAAELQEALLPCVRATFCVKNPIPMHHILGSAIRLPLVTVDELKPEARDKAKATIATALAIKSFPHV